MLVFKIKHWNSIFENNRSREIRNPSWVAMPNRHDTLGFRTLISRPNGVALYGAWCILVQVASRCNPHGTLVCNNGLPYTARSLSLKTGLSETLISECFDVLREPEIDWLETQEGAALPQEGAALPQEGAALPQEGAALPQEGAALPQEGAVAPQVARAGARFCSVLSSVVEKTTEKNIGKHQPFEYDPSPAGVGLNGGRFNEWIKPWLQCADPDGACRAWISTVESPADEIGAFASRDRYLASEQVERGVWMEPAKFLFQQKTSKWSGKWPESKKAKAKSKPKPFFYHDPCAPPEEESEK
jgi:hypothetical protein